MARSSEAIRPTEDGKARLADFVVFSEEMIRSKDIDPIYPVLRDINASYGLDPAQSYWLAFLYVAWYHLPSALAAFQSCPNPDYEILNTLDPKWPTGIERRGNRGGVVREHIRSYLDIIRQDNGLPSFHENWYLLNIDVDGPLADNWDHMTKNLMRIHGNGRWAAYKHCEILQKVFGLPMSAPDMGNKYSTGPRKGLATFFGEVEGNTSSTIDLLDRQGDRLLRYLKNREVLLEIEDLETLLCNWHSILHGRYYIGHDIDEMLEQIYKARAFLSVKTVNQLLSSRRRSLPESYLGELWGWSGINKSRMREYQLNGRILTR